MKTMVQVIFQLVQLVEKRITAELQGTRGALLYESWSYNCVHYVATIASYCVEVKIREGSISSTENEQRLAHLQCHLSMMTAKITQ